MFKNLTPVEARKMVLDYQLKTLRDLIEKHPEFVQSMLNEGLEKYFKPVKAMTDNEVLGVIGIISKFPGALL